MKYVIFVFVLCTFINVNAQNSDSEDVKSTIVDFFDAFHKQDTIALKAFVIDNIILQSISKGKDGKSILKEDDFNQFLKSIASIPKENKFEEKLFSFNIQVDGNMANAWIPYEFWYQEKLSHCGVNSFQLMKIKEKWKIIYLVDTRQRNGCKD